MPLNIDSYTTTAGSAEDSRRLATAIKEAIVAEDLDSKPEARLHVQSYGQFHPLFITGTYPSEAKIPPFAHPISIFNIRGKNFICSDLRLLLKKEITGDFSKRIRNQVDFEFAVSRLTLNLFWAGGRSSEFRSGFSFSANAFASWVSQVLNGGLGLEMQDLVVVQIAALSYYYDLCGDNINRDAEDTQRVVDWIHALTGLDAQGISKVLERLKPAPTLSHFIENLKSAIDGLRIQKLTAGIFITLIRSSWYGLDAPKVLAVSLEHPPTWTALVYHSLSTKSYKNCLISQVVMKSGKRGEADAFMRHYHDMFAQQIRNESVGTLNPELDNHFDYDPLELSMEAASRLPELK